ncbi:hypothetical protein BJF90_25440 [Pseudonocardia sp. CNS-004]|nr:hypothetical protein BJF90_25440 [Pseudonocardia sp. CNS-004]
MIRSAVRRTTARVWLSRHRWCDRHDAIPEEVACSYLVRGRSPRSATGRRSPVRRLRSRAVERSAARGGHVGVTRRCARRSGTTPAGPPRTSAAMA